MSTPVKALSLAYRAGTSDKVYLTAINQEADGYTVTFAYGRRGATLTTGTKTAAPVTLAEAEKIFEQLVREKQAKGYTESESGTPYLCGPDEARATGHHVQLLNIVGEEGLAELFANPQIGAQEKYDGQRLLIKVAGREVIGINRRGLARGIPQSYHEAAASLARHAGDFMIDGEAMEEQFYAFDVLHTTAYPAVQELPYRDRYRVLQELVKNSARFALAPLAEGEAEKRRLYARLKAEGREGIVFKDLQAPYQPGRPHRGGTQLKFVFLFYATCQVKSRHGAKRSVALQVADGPGGLIDIGHCTIPANHEVPAVGSLVEIRYKHCFPRGSLYQPCYQGVRDDKIAADTYESLKFKAGRGEEDD